VTAWGKFLHDASSRIVPPKPVALTFNSSAASQFVNEQIQHAGDGRGCLRSGLHALPEGGRWPLQQQWVAPGNSRPITKLTWTNAAQISPATARKLGVKADDYLRIWSRFRSERFAHIR